MSRKFLFFINPVSGTANKLKLEEKITAKFEDKGLAFEILFTSKEGAYDFLYEKITNESVTDIVIAGGDGSIRPIVSSVLNLSVNIGIIPVGSGNGIARTVGIPNSVDKAIEVILSGKPKATDAFLINDQLATHVCGLGFDAKVAYDFSISGNRGLNSYTKIAVKNFRKAKTYPFTIEAEGKTFEAEAFLIAIANSNQFGNNLKVAPRASICDGLLDIVIVKKSGKALALLSFIKQVLSGRTQSVHSDHFENNNILYFQTDKVKIRNHALAPLHMDGDPAQTAEDFSIQILPSAYKLIYP